MTRKGESLVKLPPLNPSALTSHRAPAEYTNTRQSSHEASGVPSTPSVWPSPKLSPTFERSRLPTVSGPSNHAGSHCHAEGSMEADQETKPKSRRALVRPLQTNFSVFFTLTYSLS
ncbi:unnamed protein product [Dibothriocephalus latus]|uniref:Uncharacterized protein n=1 Tax=Dibothriocephalus latus TaxID=60516 RepID=A0A3P7M8G4_DIBLA|nr:unnamed protein product [Dibothriocephalus latus]